MIFVNKKYSKYFVQYLVYNKAFVIQNTNTLIVKIVDSITEIDYNKTRTNKTGHTGELLIKKCEIVYEGKGELYL